MCLLRFYWSFSRIRAAAVRVAPLNGSFCEPTVLLPRTYTQVSRIHIICFVLCLAAKLCARARDCVTLCTARPGRAAETSGERRPRHASPGDHRRRRRRRQRSNGRTSICEPSAHASVSVFGVCARVCGRDRGHRRRRAPYECEFVHFPKYFWPRYGVRAHREMRTPKVYIFIYCFMIVVF